MEPCQRGENRLVAGRKRWQIKKLPVFFLLDIGKALDLEKDPDSAAWYSDKAAVILEKIKDNGDLLDADSQSAKIFMQKKDYRRAIACYNKIIIVSRKIGMGKTVMSSLDETGTLYENLGDFKNALKCYRAS